MGHLYDVDRYRGRIPVLIKRAISIDGDIRYIVKEIGRKTYKRVLDEAKDKIAEKKARKIDYSQK